MPNKLQVRILKKDVGLFNRVRKYITSNQEDIKKIYENLRVSDFLYIDLNSANFKNANLSGANLEEADLTKADLSYANLEHVNFSKANLTKANLTSVNLNNTDFSEANLSGAKLINVDLEKARIYNTNLTDTDLSGINLNKTDTYYVFNKAILKEAQFVEANILAIQFNEADLSYADFHEAQLGLGQFNKAVLIGANLSKLKAKLANFEGANLSQASLCEATLDYANFNEANLYKASLKNADLNGAHFKNAKLRDTDLSNADLGGADLSGACLENANLRNANLSNANLNNTNLNNAKLNGAHLNFSALVDAKLLGADLTDCNIYGISVWNISTDESTKQKNLIITKPDEPTITVDNLEVAQFIYLLLNNQKIRNVIDTITSKVVLILGRFTKERKPVLDAIREKIRQYNYTPVMFDFDKPISRSFIETVSVLAHMAKFVIADFTEPKIVLQEAEHLVPDLAIPFAPIFLKDSGFEPVTLCDLRKGRTTVLDTFCYTNLDDLLIHLEEKVIKKAEKMAEELNS